MRRSIWLNATLLAAVIVLGAYVYFKPGRDTAAAYPLSTLKPNEITTVRVERPGVAALQLEKRQDGWRVTSPFAARADALRVQQLLAIAEARSAHQLPATDLARFELDQPVARVTLAEQTFSFGMVNAVTREQYVLTDDTVYPVHPRYGAALPARAADAASRQVFAADEAPVRLELRDFTVEQRAGRWMVTPGPAGMSQDDLIRWVDEWHLASALRVEQQGKARPLSEIRVRLKGGGGFTISVLARQPELVLARSDEKVQYHLRAEAAKRLLSPPAAPRIEPAKKK